MAERADSAMRAFFEHYEAPREDLLQVGDIGAVSQLWKDISLAKEFSCAEIECEHELHAEVVSLQNDYRKLVLTATPCLRALMRETASGKITEHHQEMIQCALDTYSKLKELAEETCEYVEPELRNLYYSRLN